MAVPRGRRRCRQAFRSSTFPRDGEATYQPRLLGVADVTISSAKYGINRTERVLHTVAFGDGPVPVDWSTADPLEADLATIGKGAPAEGSFAPVPSAALKEKSYAAWTRSYTQWLKANEVITLYRSAALKLDLAAGRNGEGVPDPPAEQFAGAARCVGGVDPAEVRGEAGGAGGPAAAGGAAGAAGIAGGELAETADRRVVRHGGASARCSAGRR